MVKKAKKRAAPKRVVKRKRPTAEAKRRLARLKEFDAMIAGKLDAYNHPPRDDVLQMTVDWYTGQVDRLSDELVTLRTHQPKGAEVELAELKAQLTAWLTKDQMEAAVDICKIAPEVYALNCMEIWKDDIFKRPGLIFSMDKVKHAQKQETKYG